MAKYLVETYYTCTFKVNHYLDEINESELKNLEKRRRSSDLKKYFVKNVFRARTGIPRILQKVEKFVFDIFEDKCHTNILRPNWDILVVKWRCGRINKLENAKTEIRLVPPPLRLKLATVRLYRQLPSPSTCTC